jgi:hypothetical protein
MRTRKWNPQERSVTRWLTKQFRGGCRRIVLQSRVDDVVRDVGEWDLDSMREVPSLAESITDAMNGAEPVRLEPMLFGLFSFEADSLAHSAVAFLLRRGPL